MPELFFQPSPDTHAWRVFHDQRRGIWVDQFEDIWLVQTEGGTFPHFLKKKRPPELRSIYWKGREKTASAVPERVWGDRIGEPFRVRENGAYFLIDLSAGYSPGIFLDQRENRLRVREASKPGQQVLNTFAYTGAFSVMAALGGADTTTLDLSRRYLDWAGENLLHNGADADRHHRIKGDAFEWMHSFARRGRRFHGIILDPPTFSRGRKKGGKKTFRTDQDYADLTELAAKLIEPGGWILCTANTHRMSAHQFEKEVQRGLLAGRCSSFATTRFEMPPEFHGDDYLKTLWVDVS